MHRSNLKRLVVFLLVLGSSCADANSFLGVQQSSLRCGRDVVTVGQQAFMLVDKCGRPDFRQVIAYTRQTDATAVRAGGRRLAARDSVDLVTEQWVYKPGRGRFTRVLTVTGGVLTDIRLHHRN